MKPLAIDLYAGLGGWSEGLLAEGCSMLRLDICPIRLVQLKKGSGRRSRRHKNAGFGWLPLVAPAMESSAFERDLSLALTEWRSCCASATLARCWCFTAATIARAFAQIIFFLEIIGITQRTCSPRTDGNTFPEINLVKTIRIRFCQIIRCRRCCLSWLTEEGR